MMHIQALVWPYFCSSYISQCLDSGAGFCKKKSIDLVSFIGDCLDMVIRVWYTCIKNSV